MPKSPRGSVPLRALSPASAYQRGRMSALKKIETLRKAYNLAFATIRARAERAETAQGLGPCVECRFFQQHTAHWGHCNVERARDNFPDWPRPWAHVDRPDYKAEPRMAVSNSFGCVLFSRMEP